MSSFLLAPLLSITFAADSAATPPTRAEPLVALLPPDQPNLTVACTLFVAHTDYVRVTFAAPTGETTASAEASISQPANSLTVVQSPPVQLGAIGYNVYAVQNNGGSGTGETLQNLNPIPIGTNYREPVTGWRSDTTIVPSLNNSLAMRPLRRLSTPPAPTLAPTACSLVPAAHSDYVKVTYVTADGETTSSAESVLSQGASALTIVHSPVIAASVTGYNVYAIKNNGGSGAGETLQNGSPIAIGTNYEEPPDGWTSTGRGPPSANTALVPEQGAAAKITQLGGYVDATAPNGAREALVLPANDSRPGTSVSVISAKGIPIGAPQPQVLSNVGSLRPVVVETLVLALSDDVTFSGYPTFKLTIPKNVQGSQPPYIVELYDGASNSLIATMPAFNREDVTFLSDYSSPFSVVRNRRYYAELVANSPFTRAVDIVKAPVPVELPPIGGIRASVTLPGLATSKNTGVLSIFASAVPPVGIPRVSGSNVESTLYYASIVVKGTAVPSGMASLSVTLPPSSSGERALYRLAAYDSAFSSAGWYMGIKPAKRVDNVLSFDLKLPHFIGFRQYGVALYASRSDAKQIAAGLAGSQRAAGAFSDIVVIGDSLSLLTILPPSGADCVAGWGPLPECQYSIDPALNWPGFLAKITGRKVQNLSQLGAETIYDEYFGASMLELQVPQLESKTKVVIVDWGAADLGLNDQSPATSVRALTMTHAILARSPHAHIVYVSIHCGATCSNGVNAWNEEDKRLGEKYGAFIDLHRIGANGTNAQFPDGGHPSLTAARTIAMTIATALHRFAYPRR